MAIWHVVGPRASFHHAHLVARYTALKMVMLGLSSSQSLIFVFFKFFFFASYRRTRLSRDHRGRFGVATSGEAVLQLSIGASYETHLLERHERSIYLFFSSGFALVIALAMLVFNTTPAVERGPHASSISPSLQKYFFSTE